nr:MAG TPA: hypothetical protein [Bacteriophage sp.]DAX15209.1 MAG TPA: hypothetical protein [Bacteriophage sp.]
MNRRSSSSFLICSIISLLGREKLSTDAQASSSAAIIHIVPTIIPKLFIKFFIILII